MESPTVEEYISFLSEHTKEFVTNKYQKNMARVLLEFYDYDLKSLLRDVVDSIASKEQGTDNPERRHLFRCMSNGVLDTFDGCIFQLIRAIGVAYDEEKGTSITRR